VSASARTVPGWSLPVNMVGGRATPVS
jgi:hypothetical protein